MQKNLQTIIIAGGKGTRLGLKNLPKPMVRIGDKPVLQYQIELAKKYKSSEIFIISGYLSSVITDYFKDGSDFGIKINHIIEPYPLGTAGSLKLLEGKVNERFLVFYGDIFMNFNIKNFIDFDSEHTNSIGTTLIHKNNHPCDSDLVQVDEKNKVIKILTKPHQNPSTDDFFANSGIYIFSDKIFNYIENNFEQDIVKDIFPKIIEENLFAYQTKEYIKDIGTLERLGEIKKDFPKLSG